MSQIGYDPSLLTTLQDKVVVITGGAIGIGAEAVRLFYESGAKVVFGDVSDCAAKSLVTKLASPDVRFVHCDVTSYADQLALFADAEKAFGKVDIVIANAGIFNTASNPYSPGADIDVEPSTKEIDVNLKGTLFTARIGQHYLRKTGGGDIILVSSISGFKETPGLAIYLASKHGVIGVLRGLRLTALPEGIRINAICPSVTRTGMVSGIEAGWDKLGLPTNNAEDVARAMLICATASRNSGGKTHKNAKLPFAGKILFVTGGESYEFEDRLQELEPEWLGKENSRLVAIGQAFLQSGQTSWGASKGS